MKVSVVTRKDFNLSPRQLLISSRKELENILTSFNHTEGNNSYYFLDYYRQEIVVSSLSAPILGGFSKALADQEGFDFFERILSNKEWNWMSRVNVKMYEFFFSCPEADRKHLAFAYDLKITTIKGKQIILSHIIVPYKLCKNGNLWLGLCQVSVSPNHKSGCPTI
ncbi:MAG: hypothetical protein LBU91_08910 [Bacteroidales bacterium]|jgi:hypothetical protein|nr:hypothetical protein [Bacteroidales bacterium]